MGRGAVEHTVGEGPGPLLGWGIRGTGIQGESKALKNRVEAS